LYYVYFVSTKGLIDAVQEIHLGICILVLACANWCKASSFENLKASRCCKHDTSLWSCV